MNIEIDKERSWLEYVSQSFESKEQRQQREYKETLAKKDKEYKELCRKKEEEKKFVSEFAITPRFLLVLTYNFIYFL